MAPAVRPRWTLRRTAGFSFACRLDSSGSSNDGLLATPFVSLTVDSNGERGLLGVAFDPDFASNHFVYVYYTVPGSPAHNRVSRFTANGDVAVAGSETVILDLDNLSACHQPQRRRDPLWSGRQALRRRGREREPGELADVANRLGKILRINSDGTIPADNPTTFPESRLATGANRAIWAVGIAQSLYLWLSSRGPAGSSSTTSDKAPGKRSTTASPDRTMAGASAKDSVRRPNPTYRDPLFEYGHGSGNTLGCAIVGGAFYNPAINQFPAFYIGKYFFGDLCSGWIRLFDPSDNTASAFATGISTLVDLKVGPGRKSLLSRPRQRRTGLGGSVRCQKLEYLLTLPRGDMATTS